MLTDSAIWLVVIPFQLSLARPATVRVRRSAAYANYWFRQTAARALTARLMINPLRERRICVSLIAHVYVLSAV